MKDIYFKNFDIKINSGELINVVGPNGSGKTFFLKMICNKIPSKNIFINKKNINLYDIIYKRKNIVCVFNDNIFNNDIVENEMSYYLKKVCNSDIEERVDDFINYFSLKSIINSAINDLSIENRIYIKILSLLIIKPCLFCIDDLLTYLSIEKKMKILNYIKDNSITLINVTSNIEELLLLDKILVLNKGKKVVFDKTSLVLKNETVFNEFGLRLPFIYDINNLLMSYDLINDYHIVEKELVSLLWK